jgi:hypothetical protein
MLVGDFGPAQLKVFAQCVSGLADGRIVLVEHLTIVEYLTDVGDKVITAFVAARRKEGKCCGIRSTKRFKKLTSLPANVS